MSKFSPYNIFHSIDFTKENTSKKSFYTEIPNKSIICLICNQQILEEKCANCNNLLSNHIYTAPSFTFSYSPIFLPYLTFQNPQ